MKDEAYEEGIHTQPARVREGTGHGKRGSPSSSQTVACVRFHAFGVVPPKRSDAKSERLSPPH